MSKLPSNTIFSVLNYWTAYILVLTGFYYQPHWDHVPFLTWINQAIYFLLFLITFNIVLKERCNKPIYINLLLALFVSSVFFLNIFIGENYLFGNYSLAIKYFFFINILQRALFAFFILFTTIKAGLCITKNITLYLISVFFIIPVTLYGFHPIIFYPDEILQSYQGAIQALNKGFFVIDLLALLSSIWYGITIYIKDENNGVFINDLMGFFFIFTLINIIDDISYLFDIHVFYLSLYILTFNLGFLTIILFKKLAFISTEYGQFYEYLSQNPRHFGKVKIIRRNAASNTLVLNILKSYLYYRRNYIFSILACIAIAITYFEIPGFLTLNLFALLVGTILLCAFYNALHKKREKYNFYL